MFKTFLSNKGFTLIEMFMAVGLTGGLIAGVMTLTNNMTKSTLNTSTRSEIAQVNDEIISILSNPQNCLTTLGGKNAMSDTTTATIYYKTLEKFKVDRPFGSTNERIVNMEISATASDVAKNTSYLIINYQKKSALGGGVIPRRITLYVEAAPTGTVTNCSALAGYKYPDLPWEIKKTSFTAQPRGRYLVDTASNTVTATLPSIVTFGDKVEFVDMTGNFSTNNLTVSGASKRIMGKDVGDDMIISKNYTSLKLLYSDAGTSTMTGWRIKW